MFMEILPAAIVHLGAIFPISLAHSKKPSQIKRYAHVETKRFPIVMNGSPKSEDFGMVFEPADLTLVLWIGDFAIGIGIA